MKIINLNQSIRTDESSDGSYYELVLTHSHGLTTIQFNDHDYNGDVWSKRYTGIINILRYISGEICYYCTEQYRPDIVWLFQDMLEYILNTLFSKEKLEELLHRYNCKFYLDLVDAVIK